MVYVYRLHVCSYSFFFPSPPLAENTKSHKLNTGSLISYYKTNSKTLTQLTSYQQAQLTEVQTACKISAESVIPCLIYPSHTACANCDAKSKLGRVYLEGAEPASCQEYVKDWEPGSTKPCQHHQVKDSEPQGLFGSHLTKLTWLLP